MKLISIHALRGEGDTKIGREIGKYIGISIHALRGEGDRLVNNLCAVDVEFQSTPSGGRATTELPNIIAAAVISIHALRGEGDCKNIQIYNIAFVHSVYKIIYFCDSCAFYLT